MRSLRLRRWHDLLVLIVVTVLTPSLAGCAVRRFEPSAGPWLPAPDAAAIWAQTTGDCRATTAMRASLRLSGRVGPQQIPGFSSATLGLAVTSAGDVALDARHSGRLLFQLGGNTDRVVLLWSEGPRTMAAGASEVVEALIGVRMTPAHLLSILDGCPGAGAAVTGGERSGTHLRVVTQEGATYLERTGEQWRIRAALMEGFQLSYDEISATGPAAVRIDSLPGAKLAVALSLRIIYAERNPAPPIAAAVFSVRVPADALPMTLDELRSWRNGGDRP